MKKKLDEGATLSAGAINAQEGNTDCSPGCRKEELHLRLKGREDLNSLGRRVYCVGIMACCTSISCARASIKYSTKFLKYKV